MSRLSIITNLIRKLAFPSIAILSISAIIVWGIDRNLRSQLDKMLLEDSITEASEFAEYLIERQAEFAESPNTLRSLIELLSGEGAKQLSTSVERFLVFDLYGRPIFDSGKRQEETRGQRDINETARRVIATGETFAKKKRVEVDPTGRTDGVWLAEAYVPLQTIRGTTIGVVEVYLDISGAHAIFEKGFSVVKSGVTILALVIYLVPSVAFVFQSEQRRRREKALHDLSNYDPLTGLRNRSSSAAHIEALFAKKSGAGTAVFFVDIDGFSNLNKVHGTRIGDELLKATAARLRLVAPRDAVVGRLGSDEFILAVPDIMDSKAAALAEKIVRTARKPTLGGKTDVQAHVSVGCCAAGQASDLETAIRAAGVALSHAKANGQNQFAVYSEDLDAAMREQRQIEMALEHAISQRSAEVVYQPLMAPNGEDVLGFEALARLRDSSGAPISPAAFIPVAERTGLINEFGRLVLRSALAEISNWPDNVFVSVNLSPIQFQDGEICNIVQSELERAGIAASRLELEITESVLLEEKDAAAEQLICLRDMGVRLAMDDFGTGYSSLGYLWTYDFDKLKIDRVFLENYEYDKERHRDIIETIVVLAHKMAMTVTVEGVETANQVDMLQRLKVDQLQGFFFSKPLEPKAARTFLAGSDAAHVA